MRDAEDTIKHFGIASIGSLISMLHNPATVREIIDLSVERASTIGAQEYGDRAWQKSPKYLRRETLEELADAVFYLSVAWEIGDE